VTFTVGWDPDAYRELTQLWATASDPAAVRAAREEVERLLGADPFVAGRHVAEGLWQLTVPPLVACYTIDRGRQHVEITDVFILPDQPST
jgi:hypothetical protein